MIDRIRFHLDECVDSAVADGLRRRGIDVTTTPQVGLMSASDEKQLEFAFAEARTLVTHDKDLLALARRGIPHAGIAYCHPELRSLGQMIAGLMLIRDCMTPEEMENHVEFL
jgi:hypothetical protein